jgi:hypothetical protein
LASKSMKRLLGILVLALALVAVACATTVDMGEVKQASDAAPSFAPPATEAGADALVDARTVALSCIGTECPAPWATCLAPSGPTYKCGTDLTRDNDNCGTCGNKCLVYKPTHMTSRCNAGACELECLSPAGAFDHFDYRNCNGLVDDGCEIDVLTDEHNCGACGNACAEGVSCLGGKCGCPAGRIECNGECIDGQKDDYNCGACGNVCGDPAGACSPMPSRTRFGCDKGTCGHIKCQGSAADCNGDIAQCNGDGCEIEDIGSDRNNCGACGVTCGAGEECVNEGNGPECAVPCARFGKILCPGNQCVDLLTDFGACGSCNGGCAKPGPNQAGTCSKGLCKYECAEGFADCNGDPSDGCETNLDTHPGNCGACGNACSIADGQPCIEGKCLTTACEAGPTR